MRRRHSGDAAVGTGSVLAWIRLKPFALRPWVYNLATPLSRAACATARATALPTRLSNARGMM